MRLAIGMDAVCGVNLCRAALIVALGSGALAGPRVASGQELADRPTPAALTVSRELPAQQVAAMQAGEPRMTMWQSGADGAPVALTLKRAIEMALSNSKDIQLAKIQTSLANRSAQISKSEFLPNLYAGSGVGYTYGIPETPGGRAPSVFNVTYTQEIFNEPLRGQAKELAEQAKAQRFALAEVRNSVIARTAMAYLELEKVRHSLTLLHGEQDSAGKILEVTKQRQGEGFELPVEVTKAQLTRAQVVQRILQLEGREDELEVFLKGQLGLADAQQVDVSEDDLPGEAEQEGANLVALAMENNTGLQLAESDVRAREFRLQGEKRGYLPTLQLVGIYSYLAKFNNYTEFFKTFQANNFNAGVQIRVPLFSATTKANVGLATVNLEAAKVTLANRKSQVTADVRQKSRAVREKDAAKEVARLELQLAQQNVEVLQSQFGEGRVNLREVERARVAENDRWMDYLDANFARQQAEVDLLRTAGQLDKVWQ
ncbi:MAG TPA: TolC family protein [Candidatus Acidoferrum sp.]|nr:TolC family protein [Candidatus Acidoferrum sp.]